MCFKSNLHKSSLLFLLLHTLFFHAPNTNNSEFIFKNFENCNVNITVGDKKEVKAMLELGVSEQKHVTMSL